MKNFVSFLAGVVFAVGLVVSGMTNPNIVIGFLDLFGDWDMRLLFVMGGAVAVNLVLFKIILKRGAPALDNKFHLPTRSDFDLKLVLGAALLGIGWGILGVCPGPGLVNIVTLQPLLLIFVGCMFVGMLGYRYLFEKKN